jgi:hypothetical protein
MKNMKLKTFLKEFTVAEDLAEADLDEIGYQSLEASEALREIVERAFRLGVAEGLSSAEYAMARALGITADEMEQSGNAALQTVMQMSIRCHRAARASVCRSNRRLQRFARLHKSRDPGAQPVRAA